MTKNKHQYNANVEYVAYIVHESYIVHGRNTYRAKPITRLVEEEITTFVEEIEKCFPRNLIEKKEFPLLKSIFHGAPVFGGVVGPIYGESPDTGKLCLNYIQ